MPTPPATNHTTATTTRSLLLSILISVLCIFHLFCQQTSAVLESQIKHSPPALLIQHSTTTRHTNNSSGSTSGTTTTRHTNSISGSTSGSTINTTTSNAYSPRSSDSYLLLSSLTSPFGFRWDLFGSSGVGLTTLGVPPHHHPTAVPTSHLPSSRLSKYHSISSSYSPKHSHRHPSTGSSYTSVLLSFVRPPPTALPLLSVPLPTALPFSGRLNSKHQNGCSSPPCHIDDTAHADHWDYSSHGLNWKQPSFPCGTHQSPIHIDPADVRVSKDKQQRLVELDYSNTIEHYSIANNGHSIQVDALKPACFGTLSLDGHKRLFRVRQFHFHAPAEHTFGTAPAAITTAADANKITKHLRVDDKAVLAADAKYHRRALELHIVHTADGYEQVQAPATPHPVVVIGVTFVSSPTNTPNAFLASVLSAIKQMSQTSKHTKKDKKQIDLLGLDHLLLSNRSSVNADVDMANGLAGYIPLFRYEGSFTTPPLHEGVTWLLVESPVEASTEQLNQMHEALLSGHKEESGNYRVIQNSRLVNKNKSDVLRAFAHLKSNSVKASGG
eukprot:GHVS01107821.1.p1 GENE.GHVS01107821.1~~GHVS01107821.1.p1  ORF type:complete len:555 (-),score=104.85 GHVS01107821.1:930-2594(-)